jgi:hypothetical protein
VFLRIKRFISSRLRFSPHSIHHIFSVHAGISRRKYGSQEQKVPSGQFLVNNMIDFIHIIGFFFASCLGRNQVFATRGSFDINFKLWDSFPTEKDFYQQPFEAFGMQFEIILTKRKEDPEGFCVLLKLLRIGSSADPSKVFPKDINICAEFSFFDSNGQVLLG